MISNRKFGLLLFLAYLLDYFAFVAVNAFAPTVMETDLWRGINLAVAWGFGLISVALGLAIIYGWWCGSHPDATLAEQGADQEAETRN